MVGGNIIYYSSLLIQSVFVAGSQQHDRKFFRDDYAYLQETKSFYKAHNLARTWVDAKRRCALEGAKLFYPEDLNEANAVLNYVNSKQPLTPLVFVGISSRLAKGVFLTIDGLPIRDVYNKWILGEPNDDSGQKDCVILRSDGRYGNEKCNNKHPFICKKTLQTLKWNSQCNVSYLDYKYNEEMGSCYKFHLNPLNWQNAAEACEAEQAYLAIPNSVREANYLANITAMAPKQNVSGQYLRGAVHLGFRYDEGYNDWITIRGQTLKQAGYDGWAHYQPDGGQNERCGSMFYGGELNDIDCETHKCFFICEMENDSINIISNNSDDVQLINHRPRNKGTNFLCNIYVILLSWALMLTWRSSCHV